MSQGRVEVNGLELAYVEEGQGPLALCLHGFPDSPAHFRFLLPALAAAGYRAVAPYMRGFAPSEVPSVPMTLLDLVADANALHEELGAGCDAVIIGHDWGAMTAWGAASNGGNRWSKVVGMDVPPFPFFGQIVNTFEGMAALTHLWLHQMKIMDVKLPADDFAYIDYLWQTWAAPGHKASAEDLDAVKACLDDPASQQAILSLYRSTTDTETYGSMDWVGEQLGIWGGLPSQPTLYLHGALSGVVPMSPEMLVDLAVALPEGSQVEIVEGAGHFTAVEKPDEVNATILAFLAAS
jgi:pimeloyl-ACP methyl ester carboxylesterase